MKGKQALASARRRVEVLEAENESLKSEARVLKADLKAASHLAKDREALLKTIEVLRLEVEAGTSKALRDAERRANKALKAKREAEERLALIDGHYEKLCQNYIHYHGGGPDGVDALVSFLTGESVITKLHTPQAREGAAPETVELMERVRRKKDINSYEFGSRASIRTR